MKDAETPEQGVGEDATGVVDPADVADAPDPSAAAPDLASARARRHGGGRRDVRAELPDRPGP